ncbi:unnamed protein product [Periconia digitata]|uniref:Mitochondrial F1F0 ATP synthase subunit Atp18 n=1 Tax=Periconia digitata TaxID=1303443 RepID=A0A9W4XK21_9PLEO|nr:unnamed protein product [Periconia digitata]
MSLLGKKFNGAIARPMWPFYVSGLVVLYGVNSMANAMMLSDEHKNDPRNQLTRNKPAAH